MICPREGLSGEINKDSKKDREKLGKKCLPSLKVGAIIIIGLFWKGGFFCEG